MTSKLQNDTIQYYLSSNNDKSISISQTGLSLKRDLLTTPKETIITPLDITDVNTGNTITMDRLTYLPIGLAALEAPPNPTTLHIQDTVLIDKIGSTVSNTVSWDNILIQDTSGLPGDIIQSQLTDGLLSITNTSFFGNPNTTNIYSGTITLLNDVLDNCVLSSNELQFNIPSSGNTNSVYNTGGTDLNITGSNQLNLGSGDNVNINPGVNCIINTPSGGGNGIFLNSTDGIVNMGDYQQNFNRTYYSLDDATKQILTNTPDGVIWNGDINGMGSLASSQFNVAHRYISNFCGKMASVDEVNNTIGTKLEEYGNFFITDVDVQMKEVPNYLNPLTPNGDGWYCYLMNYTGGDIILTSNDGKEFISNSFGFNTNANIRKYATVRITLTYITALGNYYWSVLQF